MPAEKGHVPQQGVYGTTGRGAQTGAVLEGLLGAQQPVLPLRVNAPPGCAGSIPTIGSFYASPGVMSELLPGPDRITQVGQCYVDLNNILRLRLTPEDIQSLLERHGSPRARIPFDENTQLQQIHDSIRLAAESQGLVYEVPVRAGPPVRLDDSRPPQPITVHWPIEITDQESVCSFLHSLSRKPIQNRHVSARWYILSSFERNRDQLIEDLFRFYSFYVFGSPPRRLFEFVWRSQTGGAYSILEFSTEGAERRVRIVLNEMLITDCQRLRDVVLYQMAHAMEFIRPGRYYFEDYAKVARDELQLTMAFPCVPLR